MGENDKQIVSSAELLEMVRDGAILRRDSKPTTIDRFDELIDQLKALVDSQTEQAAADLARSKTQLEVLATLQATIKKTNATKVHSAPDLKPLMSVLSEIQASNTKRSDVAYQFDIQRVEGGLMTGVRATPIGS